MAPLIAGEHPDCYQILVYVDGVDVTGLCIWVDPETGEGECYLPRNGAPYAVWPSRGEPFLPRTAIRGALVLPRPTAPPHLVERLGLGQGN